MYGVAPPPPPPGFEGRTSPPRFQVTERVRSSPATKWIIAGTTTVACAGLGAYLFLVDPNVPSNAYPQCPLKVLTGIDCPGCGGLRATHSLVHGDIAGAISHNFLALVIVPLIAYFLARWILGMFDFRLPELRLPAWTTWGIPVFMLVFTIVRNIGGTPFYYLNSAT